MSEDIHQTTMRRCKEHQDEARTCASYAAKFREADQPALARGEQLAAAEHHEEMRIRLERLIGAA